MFLNKIINWYRLQLKSSEVKASNKAYALSTYYYAKADAYIRLKNKEKIIEAINNL